MKNEESEVSFSNILTGGITLTLSFCVSSCGYERGALSFTVLVVLRVVVWWLLLGGCGGVLSWMRCLSGLSGRGIADAVESIELS